MEQCNGETIKKLKTLCLFSGGGGLSYGLENSGFFETVAFCEINKYRQKVLFKNNPNKYIFSNIYNLGFKNGSITYRGKSYIKGRIGLVCGGAPCQPFSKAGSKKGKEDDRDLWPEMFRIIKEVRPTWVLLENVDDFIDMAFARTKINLESESYSVRPFIIPACAVGAQHRRDRAFIIAYLNEDQLRLQPRGRSGPDWQKATFDKCARITQPFANSLQEGWGRKTNESPNENNERDWEGDWWTEAAASFGSWWGIKSGVGRIIHGVSPGLDRDSERIRRERVEAMGDSVVPELVEIIGRAMGGVNG